MKKILVTGGAGFIGSHLVDRLIQEGNEIIVLDDLSSGKKENISQHFNNSAFKFYEVNLLSNKIDDYFKDVDEVWHLAANPDVRVALRNTRVDIDQNILVTYNVLESMRKNDVQRILFTSSSTVYGEAEKIPTPEDAPLRPISLYGASKLACEALISAYSHTFDINAVIFRLANILGPRMTHGVVYDFVKKLKKNPKELEILGDGNQKKSYLYITDCIEAMIVGRNKAKNQVEIFNIGLDEWITVKKIAEKVTKKMNLAPRLKFTGGKRGWKGDVPMMLLDIKKIRSLGWDPRYSIEESLDLTLDYLLE